MNIKQIERGDVVVATFQPKRLDDLKPEARNWIGYRGTWEYLWTIEAGNYIGQIAFGLLKDRHKAPFVWVPECDLDAIVVFNTIAL